MENKRDEKWIEDIDQLALELPLRHKNFFHQLKKKDFDKAVQNLKKNLGDYPNYSIIVGIAQIIALAGDAHTALSMPITGVIPFEFYWFPEGIYIVATSKVHTAFLHCRVTHINRVSIEEVIQRLSSIVSHENNGFLKAQITKYLPAGEVLYGLGITDDATQVELTLELPEGNELDITVTTEDYHKNNKKILKINPVSEESLPLYRRNKDKSFWSFFIKEQNTLYFNYSSCKDMKESSVIEFCIDLMNFIDQENVEKLVIDLRNNLGGNSTFLENFIRELRKCKKLNREGGIFVILGRETFSSALLNAYSLKNKTKAIFVGEATGGKPNCYGEVQYFDLNNSKLKIRYSTQYYKIIKEDKQLSFYPEVTIEVTFKDYIENRDPCMAYILKY